MEKLADLKHDLQLSRLTDLGNVHSNGNTGGWGKGLS